MNCGRLVIIVDISVCLGFSYDGGRSLHVSYVCLVLLFAHACFCARVDWLILLVRNVAV